MSNALNLLHSLVEIGIAVEEDREYRSLIHAELGFEADGGVAPEWLPERSLDSGIAKFHDFSFGPAGSKTEFAGFCVEDG